ncbi:Signal recognition particle SEC65 subunit [Lachnellula hyalina]|uniref:Signal recognition particle SEC65 subunit n=1 Tax=Lachnellula hyalina TaxID=1316788 RepID=A0A8H8QWK1_9HELO|nr:Signal recognition particle SEC65 subunit [Lachnellula hyalina]TVY24133.1 Signal recognition particle SEC65 subunit [Lachnellula hyalina]
MSHARIEEVSDSDEDSDPAEGDISDLDSDLDEREVLRQRAPPPGPRPSQVTPPNLASRINPANIPSTGNSQFQTTEDDSKYKDYQCIYPVYFDARRSRNGGRMVGKALAVQNPFARDIAAACGQLGLEPLFEAMKFHPKDWSNPGRVKVKLRDGKNPGMVKNKHHLYILISKYLKANPTTEKAALAIRIPGLPVPDPKKPYQPPDVPKGWKINNILPYYSPAMHGEGVSDNFMKDMMAEMAAAGGGGGGMPDMSALQGMMGGMGGMGAAGPSGGAAGGGESKKKDKKKKIKG